MMRAMVRLKSVLVMVLIIGVPLMSYAAFKKTPAGAVVAWNGTVHVDRADTGKRVVVEGREIIYKDDTVVTGAASRAKLLMNDDSILALGANSSLKVQSYEVSIFKSFRSSVLNLSKGTIRCMVNRYFDGAGSGFKVVTPNVTAGIKGTDFIIKDTGYGATVAGISGEVAVSSSATGARGEVVVKAGYMSKVDMGTEPSSPIKTPEVVLSTLLKETELPVGGTEGSVSPPVEKPAVVEKKIVTGCAECHAKVFADMGGYTHPHADAERSCKKCHMAEVGSVNKAVEAKYRHESSGGMFLLDVSWKVSYAAVLTVRDTFGKEAKTKPIGVDSSLKSLEDDKTPPVVSGIIITEVSNGESISATIEWKTDKMSKTILEYGESSGLGSTERPDGGDKFLTTSHKVRLDKLKSKQTYYIKAVAEDVFGNKAASKPLKFKTDKFFASKSGSSDAYPVIRTFEAVRIGDRVGVLWSAGKPVVASVVLNDEAASAAVAAVAASKDPHAPGFKNVVEAGSFSCDSCHKGGIHKQSSHPIGQMNWEGKRRDKSLPYDVLDNMMCSTCHSPHGSNNNYMLRKKRDKLCSGCHL